MIIGNKYELVKKISQGSFGSVYKAENIRTGRKILNKEFDNGTMGQ